MNFMLKIAAPEKFQPDREFLERMNSDHIQVFKNVAAAAGGADVLYTDVWVSMGKESESAFRLAQLAGYQINKEILRVAAPDALVMHCLPAYREKEITDEIFEQHAEAIFDQAENRLHAQKAILSLLANSRAALH